MPSIVEGFGLALAEAMACGKIVIASDIPPFKEIINDGENGFLFKSKDINSLKDVISYVYFKLSSAVKYCFECEKYHCE